MDHSSLVSGGADGLPHSPAAARNADPILEVLRRVLPARGTVLEIASGTGQHVVHFAAALPALRWQPSDSDRDAIAAVTARVRASGLDNVEPILELDVCADDWPIGQVDAVVCCNLLHIAPWPVTPALLAGAAARLPGDAPLVVYGPFRIDGEHTAASNARFDADLRARDARWGIRDLADVVAAADAHGLAHAETLPMPANNLVLVFRRRRDGRPASLSGHHAPAGARG